MNYGLLTVTYLTNDYQMRLAVDSIDSIYDSCPPSYHVNVINYNNGFDLAKLRAGVTLPNERNSLSSAWNLGLRYFARNWNVEYILLPNLDIVAGASTIANLIQAPWDDTVAMCSARSQSNKTYLESISVVNHIPMQDEYSFFMIKNNFIHQHGFFDENLKPAYFEDQDMQIRVQLSGKKHLSIEDATYYHYGSSTIYGSNDPAQEHSRVNLNSTSQYMTAKWGGIRENVAYTSPFNNPNNSLSFWLDGWPNT